MLNRRRFFAAAAGLSASAVLARAGSAAAAGLDGITTASMRGSIDATDMGVYPGALDDQSKAFARMLQTASDRDMPLFLPPGIYVAVQPDAAVARPPFRRARRVAPGLWRRRPHAAVAEDAEHIELTGIVIDGANRWLSDNAQGMVDLRRVRHAVIDNCQIVGSGKNGIALERVAGRIENTEISGAADAGIYSVEASGLQITGNSVSDCANGGILVHRWQPADDGTIVSGNRVDAHRRRATAAPGRTATASTSSAPTMSWSRTTSSATAPSRRSAPTAPATSRFPPTPASGSGETGDLFRVRLRRRHHQRQHRRRRRQRHLDRQFQRGRPHGRLLGQHRAQPVASVGPYQQDPPGFGVGISVEADCAVTGNVVENVPLYGMQIGWGEYMRNVVATGNVIRKAGTGIIISVVEGTGSAVISDNVIDSVRDGAIVGYRWARAGDRRPRGRWCRRLCEPHRRAQPRELRAGYSQRRRRPEPANVNAVPVLQAPVATRSASFACTAPHRANSFASTAAHSDFRRRGPGRRRISARCRGQARARPRSRRLRRRS